MIYCYISTFSRHIVDKRGEMYIYLNRDLPDDADRKPSREALGGTGAAVLRRIDGTEIRRPGIMRVPLSPEKGESVTRRLSRESSRRPDFRPAVVTGV